MGELSNQILTVVGNGCRHARDHHNGSSIFIECDSGMLIIYEGSRCDANSCVYVNKFGEPIKLSETVARYGIQNYSLDKVEMNRVKKLYMNSQVSEYIVTKGLSEQKFITRGHF